MDTDNDESYESRGYRHEPAISPTLLFTEEEVEMVDWDAVFANLK